MSTRLKEVLRAHEKELLTGWFEQMLNSYPVEARKYFKKVNSDFTNPVGANLYHCLDKLLHTLLSDAPDADTVNENVHMILRIKAVQEVLPSQAVSFVPALKQVVEQVCGKALQSANLSTQEWLDFYSDLDTVALYAFDSYSESRELIYKMRLDQIRQTNDILVRADLVDKALDMQDFMQCSSSLDVDQEDACASEACASCPSQCQVNIEKGV